MDISIISTLIAIAAFVVSTASMIWVGGFRFSALVHEVKTLKIDMQKFEAKMDKRIDGLEDRMEKRFEKIEQKFEKMDLKFEKLEHKLESLQVDYYKMDIRVTRIET